MSVVFAIVAIALAVVVGAVTAADTGSTFLGTLAAGAVIVVYAIFARENHQRKVNGKPPIIQFRRKDDEGT